MVPATRLRTVPLLRRVVRLPVVRMLVGMIITGLWSDRPWGNVIADRGTVAGALQRQTEE